MNIKQLHYFYELAQHRHFAKAAKACFITQPTLSASITALEKSLGTELVVRNSQFVALTQAGEVVLRHAERMLLEQDAMRQELSLFGGALSGTLRIGMVPQSSIDIMPLLKRFNDAFPNVRLRLSVMTHGTLLEQLDLHQTDIGLGFDELLTEHQRRALDVQLRHPNPMALLGPLPPHLSPSQPLRLADLQDLPLILPSATMQFRRRPPAAQPAGGAGDRLFVPPGQRGEPRAGLRRGQCRYRRHRPSALQAALPPLERCERRHHRLHHPKTQCHPRHEGVSRRGRGMEKGAHPGLPAYRDREPDASPAVSAPLAACPTPQ